MTIRVGLVGYGYWGPNLARNFHQLGALTTICDRDGKRLSQAQRLYPAAKTTSDYRELLEDKDIHGVVIATPAQTHLQLAKEALEAGKHILVEKPMTMTSKEGEELVATAQKYHRILMVGHIFEYNPAVIKIKELISQGNIGRIYYIYSTRVNLGQVQRDLNALWSIAPHDLSILLYLLEAMPLEVSVRGASYLNSQVEDVVFIHLMFPEGIAAHVHASWLDPSKMRRVTIVGSQKMVVYDDVDNEAKVKVYDKGVHIRGEIYGEFQYRLHSGDISIPQIDLTEPLRNECSHFLSCIEEGKTPQTDGHNGLRVVRVLEAAQRSLNHQGKTERV
ncbi:MAG: Gfo/Idh/MocA family oxidoreductase [Chloroflexi bacterium]|nr:Gfo/Idh/MocA family oxidoreductase [Chloroflexota bacterium]